MSQLRTLLWLKWTLFKNSFRSSKGAINRVATILGLLVALFFSLVFAIGFGASAYVITRPGGLAEAIERGVQADLTPGISAEFIFFAAFGFCYLIWATVPLSTGSGRQFDPGSLLMYPISLKKLFALDLITELTTLPSIIGVPAALAIGIGAGLGTGNLWRGILASVLAAAFGLALTKWLSTAVGSLTRKRRSRGETLIALTGAVLGLGAAVAGQVAPVVLKHADSIKALRWTPPGAAAFALSTGLDASPGGYWLAVSAMTLYIAALVFSSYWIARRAVLGIGGRRRKVIRAEERVPEIHTGWELPFVSSALSAVIEKELRYVSRNAQVRMMAVMPLILIVIRVMNSSRMTSADIAGANEFLHYGQGLMAAGGVLYVFLILSGLSCNLFAFEEAGMRALILAPVERKHVLLGKNIAVTVVALILSGALLLINHLIFRDLTLGSIFFVVLTFVIFAAMMSLFGNWLSIRFPKRMKFGKRMNVSGVVGLLLIPMITVFSLPPLAATAAGYITRSLAVEYVTLSLLAVLAVGFYALIISSQGELLQRREIEVLEAVQEPTDE
ncbi:MAG TPA: hypothetical protein VJ023_09980 [Pyrinomonadaceae bacterium]|nr:hypothetical protein [Pyrinomonadaceae bacterium]